MVPNLNLKANVIATAIMTYTYKYYYRQLPTSHNYVVGM